jgi:arylsulfatase A-like enzyme
MARQRGRRISIKTCMLAALGSTLIASSAPGQTPSSQGDPETNPPNVLLIIADDQRAETLSSMPKTSAAFAARGTSYSQAYTVSNACCPARASIFTGRYPHNHGVIRNGQAENLDHSTTVQAYLDDAGYTTAIAGKYFMYWYDDPVFFDRFATLQSGDHGYYGYYTGGQWSLDGTVTTVERYSTNFIKRRALSFLSDFEEDDARPWFMVLTPTAPHSPYTPAEKFRRARVDPWKGNPAVLEEDRSDKPLYVQESQMGKNVINRRRAVQIRTLLSVDDLVERVDTELLSLNEKRNTLAIYVSDSGYLWGEHHLLAKSNPYTNAIKIPLMFRHKEYFPAGSTSTELVGNIDIAPTIMDIVGLEPDVGKPMDGISLLDPEEHDRLLLHNPARRIFSTRALAYQYVQNFSESGELSFEEYYDLLADLYQLINLLGDEMSDNDPDVELLRAQMALDKQCSGISCP